MFRPRNLCGGWVLLVCVVLDRPSVREAAAIAPGLVSQFLFGAWKMPRTPFGGTSRQCDGGGRGCSWTGTSWTGASWIDGGIWTGGIWTGGIWTGGIWTGGTGSSSSTTSVAFQRNQPASPQRRPSVIASATRKQHQSSSVLDRNIDSVDSIDSIHDAAWPTKNERIV